MTVCRPPKPESYISREDMTVAQLADPSRIGVNHADIVRGQAMMVTILQRMDKLVNARVYRSYHFYGHANDYSIAYEDLYSSLRENLILGIYRYHSDGKLEPYNYLMGVVHTVLITTWLRRNRKKRIPPHMLVYLGAPIHGLGKFKHSGDGNDITLEEAIPFERDVMLREEEKDYFKEAMDKFSVLKKRVYRFGDKSINCFTVVKLMLKGYTLEETAQKLEISVPTLRKILRKSVTPALLREEALLTGQRRSHGSK